MQPWVVEVVIMERPMRQPILNMTGMAQTTES